MSPSESATLTDGGCRGDFGGAPRPAESVRLWRPRALLPIPAQPSPDGTEIFYKDWGSGQPIVFSHGWPLSADDGDAQMMFFLGRGYRLIARPRSAFAEDGEEEHVPEGVVPAAVHEQGGDPAHPSTAPAGRG